MTLHKEEKGFNVIRQYDGNEVLIERSSLDWTESESCNPGEYVRFDVRQIALRLRVRRVKRV
jgi:cold shock CspA family protein